MSVAVEGQVPLAVMLLGAVTAAFAGSFAVAGAFGIGAALVLWAFREIPFFTPASPLGAVAPASGHVFSVAIKRDPWLANRSSLRIVQRVRLPGFIAIRAPLEGTVKDYWVRGGTTRANPDMDASPTCYTLWLQTDEGDDFVLAIHGRKAVSRFRAQISPGERVGHGHRLGFVYFATAISIYLPAETETELVAKTSLIGGATSIGVLARPEPVAH